ncbi:glycoside hydrolase/phage tail family protein [uncultured Jannaschia sp.]|uniref:baseplate multidomain protein megatron n=1 Tax=uncultured Jannaschia sp. TaxID=293347 RepID=UPI00260BFE7E|nr:glycoside hydrolase/phage tail family protein [uncultured Jannaschia sp.]
MATLALGAAGAAIGGSVGGSLLGLSPATLGRAAGAFVGRSIDQAVLGTGSDVVEVGKLERIRLTGSSEGTAIPRLFGRNRISGQIIWASEFQERKRKTGGGKGSPAEPERYTYSYSVSLAVALCEGEIRRVGRVWADGVEVAKDSLHLRVYSGCEDQQPDSLIEATYGRGRAPAYRGTAYVVFEDLDLAPFGNRVPQFTFEVFRSVTADGCPNSISDIVQGIALVPGTGEYALATTPIYYDYGLSNKVTANSSSGHSATDFILATDNLIDEFPNLKTVSLVVSWFGNDLRCANCEIRPCVEQNAYDGKPKAWNVAGVKRSEAPTVPFLEGRPAYGGTPSDDSVKEAITHLRHLGLDITFYPFVLMSQTGGNGLPDPWGGEEQAVLPWRGRICTTLAPGQPGTPDGSSVAEAEVARFFHGTTSGEWTYNRFILHYAKLCAEAGGVESFCIGSEMRSLTQVRGKNNSFPAVRELCDLAEQVKLILPGAKLSYAADWSEYFGYHPSDTGSVHFHLDPLWAHDAIDFIGIDNYMPLSDWRDFDGHKDGSFSSIFDPAYLAGNVAGGEGYDWFYPSVKHRDEQERIPIRDERYGESWVWRYKDLRGWWQNEHYERINGARSEIPTAWVPRSKPIRFTEYGCAAINKGTNQPNKFIDEKSSESSTPFYSNGSRDDAMQVAYHQALIGYWGDDNVNPPMPAGQGRMIDLSHSCAWAWDSRPWPYFPEMADYWSDGINHSRGHWLTGRSSLQPLSTVVAELCKSSGLRDVDVSRVRGVLRGYSIATNQSARADLQPLLLAYGIEVAVRNGTVCFFSRNEADVIELDAERFVRSDDPVLVRHRQATSETPKRVVINYADDGGNYEVRAASASRSGGAPIPISTMDLPLVLTPGESREMAERFLAEIENADETIEFSLPPSNSEVTVGSLVRLKRTEDLWRVDRILDGPSRKVEAVRTDMSVYSPIERDDFVRTRVRRRTPLPVDVQVLDLPLLSNDHRPHAPYLAVTAEPWPGPVAVMSSVDDSDYKLNTTVDASSIIGITTNELVAASPAVWDNGPELVVSVSSDALASVTLAKMLAGENAAAIGDGDQMGWEIFQYLNARLVEKRLWALSGRLRGQRGTEHAIRKPWPAGSRVVFLDTSLTQPDIPADALGLERHLRYGPASSAIDSPEFQHMTVAASGEGLMPYAPVHLSVALLKDGVEARWIRRTRSNIDGWNAVDAPLAEVRERYLVRIEDRKGRRVYEEMVEEPICRVGRDVLSTEGGAVLKVAQLSDEVGLGHFAVIALQ